MAEEITLQQIFGFEELEKLFRNFAVATGYDVAMYDDGGTELVSFRLDRSLCSTVSDRTRCVQNIRYAAKKSAELGEPYIYFCGCGLVLCSIPVALDEALMGSIVCGPVMLWDADELAGQEIEAKAGPLFSAGEKIDFCDIRQTTCEKLSSAVNILLILVNYMTAQAKRTFEQKLEIARQQARITQLAAERSEALASVRRMECSYTKYPAELEKELIVFVQRGDRQRAREILNPYLTEIFSYAGGDLNVIKAKLYEFTAFLSRAIVESGVPLERMMETIKKSTRLLDENVEYRDLCLKIVEILNDFIECVYDNRGKKSASRHLTAAIRYINRHYSEELTLVEVSGKCFVNSFYLSHLFRDEMKITFSEYLNKVRVDRAKELLLERERNVEEVSEAVGFRDAGTFSRTFKKFVGLTPAKYRKVCR